MAGQSDGESVYGDDDLDALPNDAFVLLEEEAFSYTQAQSQAPLKAAPSSDYGDEIDEEDLDKEVVVDGSRIAPAIHQNSPLVRSPIVNRAVPGPTQQEQFRQQRYGLNDNSSLANRQRYNPPPKFDDTSRVLAPVPIAQHEPEDEQMEAAGPDVLSLQRQVEEVYFLAVMADLY